MNRHRLYFATAAFLMLPVVVGCGSTRSDEEAATGNAAVSVGEECGATYPEALRHFDLAVAKAEQRSEGFVCDDDREPEATTLAVIAAEAHEAVSRCGAFKEVIKTSERAVRLRDQLKGTLGYSALIGDHDAAKDLLGGARLAEALAAGVTMYSTTAIRGNTGWLQFDADGRGSIRIVDAGSFSMRWSVATVAPDSVTVTVIAEYENEGEKSFTYVLKKGRDFYGAPNFVLEIQDNRHAPGSYQLFETYPSEC